MPAVDRLEQWLEILKSQPQDTPITLCPSEVIRLIFDLNVTRQELTPNKTLSK